MKVVAFNGSPKREGNTYRCLKAVANELEQAGIETEIIQVGGSALRGCTSCMRCAALCNGACALPDDGGERVD